MIKKVNVITTIPIYSLRVPIMGTVYNAELSIGDIAVCINSRARVHEILPSGKTISLNLRNYNKDNSALDVVATVELPVEPAKCAPEGSVQLGVAYTTEDAVELEPVEDVVEIPNFEEELESHELVKNKKYNHKNRR